VTVMLGKGVMPSPRRSLRGPISRLLVLIIVFAVGGRATGPGPLSSSPGEVESGSMPAAASKADCASHGLVGEKVMTRMRQQVIAENPGVMSIPSQCASMPRLSVLVNPIAVY
jgi:hypothetical protein